MFRLRWDRLRPLSTPGGGSETTARVPSFSAFHVASANVCSEETRGTPSPSDLQDLSPWSDEELRRAAGAADARNPRSLGLLFGGGGGDGGGGGLGGAEYLSLRAIFDMALSVLRALHHGAEVDVERARAADAGYDDARRPLLA